MPLIKLVHFVEIIETASHRSTSDDDDHDLLDVLMSITNDGAASFSQTLITGMFRLDHVRQSPTPHRRRAAWNASSTAPYP